MCVCLFVCLSVCLSPPQVVDGAEGQREVQLINRKSLRLLTCQLLMLLMSEEGAEQAGVRVEELSERYLASHALVLNPCEYGFLSLSELLKSLPYLVEVSGREGEGEREPALPGEGGRAGEGEKVNLINPPVWQHSCVGRHRL